MENLIGVKIGDKHTFDDFGLILSSKTISEPEPKVTKISVPMRDGAIDLTEALSDDIRYEERAITLNFSVIDPINTWTAKVTKIANYLHGQRMKLTFDDDSAFYYIGRVQINEFTSDKSIGRLVIEAIVDPYKYDQLGTNEPWLWNPFDFETGIINRALDITVAGTKDVVIISRRKRDYPKITASNAMTVTYQGKTYNLPQGTSTMYDILFEQGENTLTFNGNGVVTVIYRGADL